MAQERVSRAGHEVFEMVGGDRGHRDCRSRGVATDRRASRPDSTGFDQGERVRARATCCCLPCRWCGVRQGHQPASRRYRGALRTIHSGSERVYPRSPEPARHDGAGWPVQRGLFVDRSRALPLRLELVGPNGRARHQTNEYVRQGEALHDVYIYVSDRILRQLG